MHISSNAIPGMARQEEATSVEKGSWKREEEKEEEEEEVKMS